MSLVTDRPLRTLADLLERLGQVPLERIRFHPPPGTATEHDVLEIAAREDRLCELVEYFAASVRQVWRVDPKSRTVTVFAAEDDSVTLSEHDILDGGSVLPGFTLSLRDLFGELDRHG